MKVKKLIMTPGPTEIEDNVLHAMADKGTNPDLDPEFYEIYKETVQLYNELISTTTGTTFLMAGEAILGLEAACATLIEKGDKVLCIANGIFGEGFKGFIEMYGGEAIMLELPWDRGVEVSDVKKAVEANPDIKLATMVHCETPSGLTNVTAPICQYLRSEGIISIVDSVSAIGGEKIEFDIDNIDVLLGGSQKCLSAPAGMTLITLSDFAVKRIDNRTTDIIGYYLNIKNWFGWYERKWFPYTQPMQNILGLRQAILNLLNKDAIAEHKKYADYCRSVLRDSGLDLFCQSHFSNTVTTVLLPEGIEFQPLFDRMNDEHNILIGGGLGSLNGKVFRVGHMGANNKPEKMTAFFAALEECLGTFGYDCGNMRSALENLTY